MNKKFIEHESERKIEKYICINIYIYIASDREIDR